MKSPDEIQLDADRWERENNGGDTTQRLTRRDWLAGLAMQGIISRDDWNYKPVTIATMAYKRADAMIAEGNK